MIVNHIKLRKRDTNGQSKLQFVFRNCDCSDLGYTVIKMAPLGLQLLLYQARMLTDFHKIVQCTQFYKI
jgi:hypothetical protein